MEPRGEQATGAAASPPAGWYADPGGSSHLRFWNGARWTASLRPSSPSNPAQPADGRAEPALPTADGAAQPAVATTQGEDRTASSSRDQVVAVLVAEPGRTTAQVAQATGLARAEVMGLLDELQRDGRVVEVPTGEGRLRRYEAVIRLDDAALPTVPVVSGGAASEPGGGPHDPRLERLLRALDGAPASTTTELARSTGLAHSEATELLGRLQRAGYVTELRAAPGAQRRYSLTRHPRSSAGSDVDRAGALPSAEGPRTPAPSWSQPPAGVAAAPAATLTFGEAVRRGFELGFTFQGRATRPEYWWFALFQALVVIGGLVLAALPGLGIVLAVLLFLIVGVPHLAVGTRRLHDTGRSGAWLFWLAFAPLGFDLLGALALSAESFGTALTLLGIGTLARGIGGLVLLVLLVLPGEPRTNRYGPVPG